MNEKREEYFRCAGCAAVFFCAVTVLMGALPWLVYGIMDNLSYHRYVGTVTAISELVPSNITVDGRVINAAEAAFEFRLENGEVRRDTSSVYDWDADGIPDEYSVGDEYVVYTHDGYSGTRSEEWVKEDMTSVSAYPLMFIIPAFIAAILAMVSSAKMGGFPSYGTCTPRALFSHVSCHCCLRGRRCITCLYMRQPGLWQDLPRRLHSWELLRFAFWLSLLKLSYGQLPYIGKRKG